MRVREKETAVCSCYGAVDVKVKELGSHVPITIVCTSYSFPDHLKAPTYLYHYS
jgi:hypothetical protein